MIKSKVHLGGPAQRTQKELKSLHLKLHVASFCHESSSLYKVYWALSADLTHAPGEQDSFTVMATLFPDWVCKYKLHQSIQFCLAWNWKKKPKFELWWGENSELWQERYDPNATVLVLNLIMLTGNWPGERRCLNPSHILWVRKSSEMWR